MVGINHVPFRPNFYILSARFVFSDKFKISTKYRMSNSKIRRKRFGLYPIVFIFSIFYRHIPFYVFTTMCMAVAMNLLNLLSEYGLYYVCGFELVYNYLCYCHLFIVFTYSYQICWMIGYHMGRCVSVLTFHILYFSTYILSNWFVFDFP